MLRLVLAAVLLLGAGLAGASHRGPVDCGVEPEVPVAASKLTLPPGLRVGLALGSGSQHGLAHVGVIRELEARGLDVHVVSGTSAGAIVGSLWASGLSARDVEAFALAHAPLDHGSLLFFDDGFFSNAMLRKHLAAALGNRPIEAWPRRFGAVATNVATGHRRILMSGDGALAVQASSALPVMFAPVTVRGERLADGALVEPVPVDAARAMGADFVIAIDVAYRPYEDEATGITGLGFQSMHILVNALATEQLRRADVAIRLDLHERMACGPEALVAAGARAVRAAWPEIARGLNSSSRR